MEEKTLIHVWNPDSYLVPLLYIYYIEKMNRM